MSRSSQNPSPINATDIASYLSSDSSFAFEMEVRQIFGSRGIQFAHGGTYIDPHLGKPRQFDLRSEIVCRDSYLPVNVVMAIECKSLSEHAPIVVCRSPRTVFEASHHVIATTCGDRESMASKLGEEDVRLHQADSLEEFPRAITLRLPSSSCAYRPNEFVGKSIECVRRDGSNRLKGGDGEVFDRWTQALQSASSMLSTITGPFIIGKGQGFILHWALPILVVPDHRLFVADFNSDGSMVDSPTEAGRTSYYVNYDVDSLECSGMTFRFDHLEIMTIGHLRSIVEKLTSSEQRMLVEEWIPKHASLQELAKF